MGAQLEVVQAAVCQWEQGKTKPSAQQCINLLSLAVTKGERSPLLDLLQQKYHLSMPAIGLFEPTSGAERSNERGL
jgi:hypothetical protein